MAALQLGNLVIQWPLGALSDRTDRRLVIAGATAAVVLVSAVLLSAGPAVTLVALIALFALWGGLAESIYAVSTAHANDRTQAGDYVVVSSTIPGRTWATGSTVGPMVATVMLRAFGPDGLWLFFIAVGAAFAFFVVWRALQREQPDESLQDTFRALPASPRPPEWSPSDRAEVAGGQRRLRRDGGGAGRAAGEQSRAPLRA
ncbi:MAG: MFS transporter, partial [Rhodovibrio sp.]|nr:MFS transporter [Rhodovibrio sp.]